MDQVATAGAVAGDIAAEIERIPFCGFHRKLVLVLGAGMLFDAFDVHVISVVADAITSFRIADATIGFIVSASYIGQLVGSLGFGYLSEAWGRKPAFILALGSFGALSMVASFAWNAASLVWARIFQGRRPAGSACRVHRLCRHVHQDEPHLRAAAGMTLLSESYCGR